MTQFTETVLDRIIQMAWEDRTPFEAIAYQFHLTESQVVAIMRRHLHSNSFKLWRRRVHSGQSQKHLARRSAEVTRFRCSRQRAISANKISKR